MATVGSQRPARLARHLPAHGWRPIVLTVSLRCAMPRDDSTMALVPDDLLVHRSPCGSWYEHSYAFRHGCRSGWVRSLHAPIHAITHALNAGAIPDPHVTWRKSALRESNRIIRNQRIDVVLASLNPWSTGCVGRAIAQRHRVPYVLDYRDPWTLAPGFGSELPPERAARERTIERELLREASGFVANTIGQEQLYQEGFPSEVAGKTVVANNSFDLGEWRDVRPQRFDRFTILHGGNIHRSRSLIPTMRALALLKQRGTIPEGALQLLNFGQASATERDAVSELNLKGWVRFEAPLPRSQFAPYLCGADLLLVTERWPMAVPGKTFDYLATGRPILVVAPRGGDIARVVLTAGQGFVAEESETERLTEWIRTAFQRSRGGQSILPDYEPARRMQYSAPRMAGIIAGLLDRITAAQSHSVAAQCVS